MAELFHIPDECIVYATDISSWISHKWAAYTLLDENSNVFKATDYYMERYKRKYSICTVEDISYVGYSADCAIIMLEMHQSGKNWAKVEMDIFHSLASNFYDLSGRKYFLDLGDNIGTTSIYFKKKIDLDVQILAFEPDPETYRILRANFIINELPEDSILENYGLADKETDMVLYRSDSNPGSNSVVVNHNADDVNVHLISLDNYLESKNINLDEIKYVWIYTEGVEAQVFFGMEKLISTQKVPICMEWNPDCYTLNGMFDDFVVLIVDNFANYIDIREVRNGDIVLHDISDLWKTKDSKEQTDVFFIK